MRRRWIYVVLVAVAAISLGGAVSFDYLKRGRGFAQRTACVGSQVRINLTKHAYAVEHGLTNCAIIPDEVIWRENNHTEQCFSGGQLSINPVGVPPSCSFTGVVRWRGRLWSHDYYGQAQRSTGGLRQGGGAR
jgi:hypothetical protein